MTGLNIVIPQAFTDTSLPKLRDDPVLPDAGALMLIDPAHPVNPWVAGIPAIDAQLPNLVETQALAALGSVTPTDARPLMKRSAAFTGTAGLLERSSKGGLHGIVPQGGNGVALTGPVIGLPRPITRYFLQNPTHVFYTGLWIKVTRLPTITTTGLYGIATGDQQSNSCLMYFGLSSNNQITSRPGSDASDPAYLDTTATSPYPPVVGPLWVGQDSKDYYRRTNNGIPTTPSPSLAAGVRASSGIGWGSTVAVDSVGLDGGTGGKVPIAVAKDGGPSYVLYRMYIEDLTVSGRTFATVKGLDQAEYIKQVTTVGGRYYGDTHTDPATIP